jgi:ribosome maturation factor RimP
MNKQTAKIKAMMAPTMTTMGFELVGCEMVSEMGSKYFRVYIDKPEGINVDDCAKVSRQISAMFEVDSPIGGEYRLEVSSPGIERPLFELEHYRQFIGSRALVKLYDAVDGRKNFTGLIQSVEDENILLEVNKQLFTFNFDQIKKGHLMPLINKPR